MNMPHKKIMYLCAARNFLSSNPGRKIFSVVGAWKKSGYQVDHYCGGDFTTLKYAHDTQARETRAHRRRNNKNALILFILNSLSELKDILHDAKMFLALRQTTQVPDLIWERSSRLHSVGLKLAKKFGRPYVLEWKDHLIPYRFSLFISWAKRIERRKLNEADYIIVESHVLREYLIQQYEVASSKIIVAHNAVDMTVFKSDYSRAQCRERYGLSQTKLIVGYLGSYAFYHQCALMVAVAQQLQNDDIEILMVGNGRDYQQVRALAEQSQLIGRSMRFMSRVDKDRVPEILASIDIAVLPGSTDIICPIKIQEYMAMGLATIAPDYACNREIIDDGVNALLFEPGNADQLSHKIRLLRDARLRQELGLAAQQHMMDNFSWEKTWVRALNSVLQGSDGIHHVKD